MSNLIKIRGLSRGPATLYNTTTASGVDPEGITGEGGPASVRGFRVKSPIGRHYTFETGAVAATSGVQSTSGSPALVFTANYKGAYGNGGSTGGLQVAVAAGSASAQAIAVSYPNAGQTTTLITVNQTNSINLPLSTAGQIANAINADPLASQFITATANSSSTAINTFAAINLAGGSNGTATADQEPGPQAQNVAGEPIFVNVNNKTTVLVDTDDQVTARSLIRNVWRYVSLGSQ